VKYHSELKAGKGMNKLIYGLLLTLLFSFSSVQAEVSTETMVQVLQRLENLEKKMRELHGENEVLGNEIQRLKRVQKQGFLNVDERIDEIKGAKKAQSNSPKQTPNTPKKTPEPRVKIIDKKPVKPASPTPPKISADSSNNSNLNKPRAPTAYEKEVYQTAFLLMKKSPTAATKAFREYIRLQPKSPLAANAQYWIGEIMYSHNNYKGAVQEFIKVLQSYKYSDKAPDAAIKLGYSFYALKNWKYARRTFEDVLRYFPKNKNAVMLAKKRLEKMKAAGN